MSILGVKKKHVDTSEIEKEILKIKSDLLTMDTKDKHLYRTANTLNLRVLNIESMVATIKSRPDSKIISIYAGVDGPIQLNQFFNFGDGGNSFLLPNPGQILSLSFVSLRTDNDYISVNMVLNGEDLYPGIILKNSTHRYFEFINPLKVEAGDLIGFKTTGYNPTAINTLASAIIEVFL